MALAGVAASCSLSSVLLEEPLSPQPAKRATAAREAAMAIEVAKRFRVLI
jgi:hypothetical protein